MSFRKFGVALVIALTPISVALASGQGPGEAPKDPWRISVGAGALYSPDYQGSDDYEGRALPYLDIRYKDWMSLSVPEGLKVSLIREEEFRAGAVIGYRFDREADDNLALAGWGDVDGAVEAGGFAEWRPGPWRLGLDVRADVSGAHEGVIAKASLRYETRVGPARVSFGPQITWASDDYTQTYYGITPAQAAAATLIYLPYAADGGIESYGLNASVMMPIAEHWQVYAFVGVSQLAGDAADSPIVAREGDETQVSGGLFAAYRF